MFRKFLMIGLILMLGLSIVGASLVQIVGPRPEPRRRHHVLVDCRSRRFRCRAEGFWSFGQNRRRRRPS